MQELELVQADEDFYASLEYLTRRGTEYQPTVVPDGWREHRKGTWTQWVTDDKLSGVEQGWKIHVSARLERAQQVLDAVAEVFFSEGVPFKHISCSRIFLIVHHKHAPRSQSGKFCAAYPRDEETARRVMEKLNEVLAGEQGPFVLTDRRFRDSSVVHYRYGAYLARSRIRPDGFSELLVRDGGGQDVLDRRRARFSPPEGIIDPFVEPRESVAVTGVPIINGYRFEKVIVYSNGGGTYRGREVTSGREVFIKEARAHNGLTSATTTAHDRLRAEHVTLQALHGAAPGICPAPVDYFRNWEHEFLVTELVPGIPLWNWMVDHNPIIWPVARADDFAAYHRRCLDIVNTLRETLVRLHDLGYVFIDVSPRNVLIADDDSVRLVDFEVAGPIDRPGSVEPIGTPGYFPPAALVSTDRAIYDDYGLASIALTLVAPVNSTADRNPEVLAHLRYALDERVEIPAFLWESAVRFRSPAVGAATPTPAQVDAEPARHLTQLREGLIDGLLEKADINHSERVFPIGPTGYLTNKLSVAHGLAGTVHALGKAGTPLPDGVLERLFDETRQGLLDLPPGLDVGISGIAWVLADHGLVDEARQFLKSADDHPLLAESATLGRGRAGVGMAHLALFGHTGDDWHVRRAVELADSIPMGGSLTGLLGRNDAIGLTAGRTGIALLDYYLGHITGDSRHHERGIQLLHEELDRAVESDGGLLFPVSDKDRRVMPYLSIGTAGVGFVASRYLAAIGDHRLAGAMPGLVASAQCLYTVYGSLYTGMAGLGLFLADHAQRHACQVTADQALDIAKRLFMYTAPHSSGIHILGEHNLRFSCDLSHGSAGVLLFLDMLLDHRIDSFLTLDHLVGVDVRKRVGN